MAKVYDTAKEKERVILVAVDLSENSDSTTVDISLDELEELAETAGAVTVGRVVQKRDAFHPGTYIGKGKMEELRDLVWQQQADTIVCDDELSPAQYHNLQDALEIKVIDRTVMILDIFAKRASTSEGKLQVELAQLRYRASHLVGGRSELSRLGGGIGTRGPGEKKLEMDRRLINSRVAQLNRELKEVQRHREVNRQQRKRSRIPVVAVVGYTNAGKSTLLNHLTNAEVLEEDKLFATLDPTTRILELTNNQKVLMTDTVGFIRKLPHHLIDAFRSTLEEAKYADIILHVVDASNPQMDKQMYIVYDTLRNLEVEGKKIITAFNKTDRIGQPEPLHDFRAERTVHISAKYGDGLEDLKNILEEILREEKDFLECTITYRDAGVIQKIREKGELLSEEYREDGIFVRAWVPKEFHYM